MNSLDQIQIGIFEIHNPVNPSIFLGEKDLKKVFLTRDFPNKDGTQWYDIPTEPMLVAPLL